MDFETGLQKNCRLVYRKSNMGGKCQIWRIHEVDED